MSEHRISEITKSILDSLKQSGRDFTKHSIFSPSASAMWTGCSGSLVPNLHVASTAGEDAAYGTVAHGVGETWLKSGERPDHLIGTVETVGEFEIEIDDEMLSYVEQYVDWCMYLPGVHFVETRVDHSDLTPLKNQTGTADFAACTPGELCITDLKMGKGVPVFAEGNTQGVIYAYGFFVKYDPLFDFQTIRIRIAQPRLDNFDEWVITREELLTLADWIRERAFAAWCNDAERSPSEKACKWCRVRSDCAAHAVFAERLIDGAFDNLDESVTADDMSGLTERIDNGTFTLKPVPLSSLSVEQKAAMLAYRKMIEGWFKELYDDLERRCINGEAIPGYKLVTGRSRREFVSDEDAAEWLDELGLPDEVIHPRGMISPSQAETALVKRGYKRKELPGLLGKLIRKPPGSPTMAPDVDKRQTVVSAMNESFDNLDEL